MEEDYNSFKITCQLCGGFVICKGRIGEFFYITFLHYVLSTIGLYHEEFDQ